MGTQHEALARATIVERMHAGLAASRPAAHRMVGSVIDHIADALGRGENTKITGFGSSDLNDKTARTGRNSKTGVEALVSARRVVALRPSRNLRTRVSRPDRRARPAARIVEIRDERPVAR
ncbi:HU family DNA-binding protein [Novosphingobium gossypii]|uniref:HU family DNA-binding protein n=1 Tax=Novosphingobium gossypii TaxID=1604774 RepID=UPI003D2586C9